MKRLFLAAALCVVVGAAKADTVWWHVDYVNVQCVRNLTPLGVHAFLRNQGITDSIVVNPAMPPGRRIVTIFDTDVHGAHTHINFYESLDDCKTMMASETVPTGDLK